MVFWSDNETLFQYIFKYTFSYEGVLNACKDCSLMQNECEVRDHTVLFYCIKRFARVTFALIPFIKIRDENSEDN